MISENLSRLEALVYTCYLTQDTHNLIKDKRFDLTLHVMTEMHFLLQKNLKISCMVVSKCK